MKDIHGYKCRCSRCVEADRRTTKRKLPLSVINEIKEKAKKKYDDELKVGVMDIQCPHCQHYIKVKISSRIDCYRCGKVIS